ncbi:hypothetical protein AB0I81_39970 [Nonomuraea sp. NPDC050404]|uniref:hypothetical protein n=1 Tax=Nonomuraea sp. NPDC050404 TaxID=3155783 RepID=UPI0033C8BEB8
MPRVEARVFVRIWDDEHFLALSPNGQRFFLFLLSQADLTYCGTLILRERKWASKARGLTVADVCDALAELAKPPALNPSGNPSLNPSANPPAAGALIVTDEDTEELLIRSLIRLDRIWKEPNLMRSARNSALLIDSAKIRAALLAELLRIPDLFTSDTTANVRSEHAVFVEKMGGPPAPSDLAKTADERLKRKGSRKTSPKPSAKTSRGKGAKGEVPTSPSRTNTGSPEPHGSDDADASPQQASTKPSSSATPAKVSDTPPRLDVERVCKHLADAIEAHGLPRPTIGQGWRDAARRMIDLDGIPERQIIGAIEWAHGDEFWHRNILSVPTLRKQFPKLWLAAKAEKSKTPKSRNAQGNATAYQEAMAHALAAEAAATGHGQATAHQIVIPGHVE